MISRLVVIAGFLALAASTVGIETDTVGGRGDAVRSVSGTNRLFHPCRSEARTAATQSRPEPRGVRTTPKENP